MTGWIGISCGDVTGIGPEVTLKALAEQEGNAARVVLFGDFDWLERLNRRLGLEQPLARFEDFRKNEGVFCHNPLPPLPEHLTPGAPLAAQAALAWLEEGARRCLAGELDALVTAPLNKAAILRLGRLFVGQTEWLSQRARAERTAMMLVGDDGQGHRLRVALATTHLPLRKVADELSVERIFSTIELAGRACRDFGLAKARVGVCGLNPHAGEGGELGREEIEVIAPAVARGREKGLDVSGPHPADTLFYQAYRGSFEAVVAMYHDQGLAPLKMIGFDRGVNLTLGLPFVRTSPDHGTAYDIAGQGRANPSSMRAAIDMARQLARRRG